MKMVFNKYLELEEVDLMRQWFYSQGHRKEYKKNDLFICEGGLSQSVGFVEFGSFRYLKWNDKSAYEQIVGYSFENDFVVDYGSLRTETRALVSIQAMKDSVVWVLDNNLFDLFFDSLGENDLRARFAELLFLDVYGRLMSFYIDSPTERYLKLIGRFPDILELVSLKEIASYIRVTPETLSRIRKKLISM